MTFEQLEFFIASVECENFLDAAERVNTSQSTLSKQIKKLELELGVTLYDRSKRSASLTEAGQVFFEEAKKLTKNYKETLEKMKRFKETSSKLSIGTLPFLAQYDLTLNIQAFVKENSRTKITIDEVEEPNLLSGLENDTYEFIITRKSMIDETSYIFAPITTDTLAVMLPKNHPLASKEKLSLHDISNESFVLMNTYTSIYQLCMSLFEKENISPNILRTSRMESIISTVRLGQAISIFPISNFKTFEHSGLKAVPLSEAPTLIIGTACKKKNLKKMEGFISSVRK